MDESEWWYVRVYPGRPDLMDEAARIFVPWLAESADCYGASAWFFMRYVDLTGQHLRLRLRVAPDAADELHSRLPKLQDLVRGLDGTRTDSRLVASAEMATPEGVPRACAGFYAPELRKYGGPTGVRTAERLFTASSRWYLTAGIAASDLRTDRAALAVRLLRTVVAAAVPDQEAEFWAAHRKQWGTRLRSAMPSQTALRELTRATATTVARAATPIAADGHGATLVAVLEEALAAGVAVPRAELLLHYLHMEMNRLGFLPAEECLLGLVAAGWPRVS